MAAWWQIQLQVDLSMSKSIRWSELNQKAYCITDFLLYKAVVVDHRIFSPAVTAHTNDLTMMSCSQRGVILYLLSLQETFGSIQRHFWLSQLRLTKEYNRVPDKNLLSHMLWFTLQSISRVLWHNWSLPQQGIDDQKNLNYLIPWFSPFYF